MRRLIVMMATLAACAGDDSVGGGDGLTEYEAACQDVWVCLEDSGCSDAHDAWSSCLIRGGSLCEAEQEDMHTCIDDCGAPESSEGCREGECDAESMGKFGWMVCGGNAAGDAEQCPMAEMSCAYESQESCDGHC